MDSPRWLNAEEQQFWRKLLHARRFAVRAIDDSLQESSGISSPEFSVLVLLSEHESKSIRLNELGQLLDWDRSRVSHQITRMEKRGLVTKQACDSDRRGIEVAITESGWEKVRAAAANHVETVRTLFFDHLQPSQQATLEEYLDQLLAVKEQGVRDIKCV